jgi:hypothetical protein
MSSEIIEIEITKLKELNKINNKIIKVLSTAIVRNIVRKNPDCFIVTGIDIKCKVEIYLHCYLDGDISEIATHATNVCYRMVEKKTLYDCDDFIVILNIDGRTAFSREERDFLKEMGFIQNVSATYEALVCTT